jgi:hypothetical protein
VHVLIARVFLAVFSPSQLDRANLSLPRHINTLLPTRTRIQALTHSCTLYKMLTHSHCNMHAFNQTSKHPHATLCRPDPFNSTRCGPTHSQPRETLTNSDMKLETHSSSLHASSELEQLVVDVGVWISTARRREMRVGDGAFAPRKGRLDTRTR